MKKILTILMFVILIISLFFNIKYETELRIKENEIVKLEAR